MKRFVGRGVIPIMLIVLSLLAWFTAAAEIEKVEGGDWLMIASGVVALVAMRRSSNAYRGLRAHKMVRAWREKGIVGPECSE